MKTTKKRVFNNMTNGVAKVAGKVALGIGVLVPGGSCLGFAYEPEIPRELLKNKPNCK